MRTIFRAILSAAVVALGVSSASAAPPASTQPLTSVTHDATLTGSGTASSPLGVNVNALPQPLTGTQGATVAAQEDTTSTSYADLDTPGPSVTTTIALSGRALVTVTGFMNNNNGINGCFMGFEVSGATSRGPSDTQSLSLQGGDSALAATGIQASVTYLVTGLTPGSNTFTAKYRVGGGLGTFVNRHIIVIPLP